MQVGRASFTVAAAEAPAEFNSGEIVPELRNEIGGVEEAPVLAAPETATRAIFARTKSPSVRLAPVSRA